MFMNFGDIDFNVLDTQMAAAVSNLNKIQVIHTNVT